GVLSYFVSQRSRELGIRLALGARPASLFRLVSLQGLRPVALGAVVGLAGALGLAGVVRSLLFRGGAIDPPPDAASFALLAGITAAACALPALRATRIDPLTALRDE